MFKPITITAEDIQAKAVQREAAKENVASVFKVLHGFYGNLFLSKFANGVNDEDTGADQGVESAKGVWGHGLRAYGTSVVKAALAQCLKDHPKFPPSLPEFVAMCEAHRPRQTYFEAQGLPMLPPPKLVRVDVHIEPVGDGKDQFRKILARHLAGDKTLSPFSVRSAIEVLGVEALAMKQEANRAND